MSLATLRKQYTTLVAGVRSQLAEMDGQLAALRDERKRLAGAWRPRAETQTRLEQTVDAAAERYARRLEAKIASAARPETLPGSVQGLMDGARVGEQFDADALSYFFGDHIKSKVGQVVKDQVWHGFDNDADGIPVEGRRSRLEELDLQITELESERDALRGEIASMSQ